MSTQDLPAVRSALATTTYPPEVASVRAARRFVVDVLSSSGLPGLADDAGLVVSELAANAVLHARSPFDVVVQRLQAGVRVSVRDSSPAMPVLVAPSASAMSGRGLALVERLVARWGAGPSRGAGKSVWFEIDEEPAGDPVPDVAELSVEELLAAWSDEVDALADAPRELVVPVPPAGPTSEVVLPVLVAAHLLAAKERMDDVLRELQLVLLAQGGAGTAGVGDRALGVARRLDEAARAFDDVRRQVRHQVSRAVADGQERVALVLQLPPGTAERATAYRDAVEAAEVLAELGGALLSAARTPAQQRAVRRAYLDEVIAATRG
ncbi:ATP-binding protein [Streptomyces sp. NP160]|uniref:ATP-binding protein n=1 Tax=Streptomyces sp. NP160 TaxID=2586637 RepID=UPI00111A7ADA|nr:ATP-binding protein [Streptomyces sp. NP160]TNM69184.1 ATP-binding protein [Streptomyces sp. NP160]